MRRGSRLLLVVVVALVPLAGMPWPHATRSASDDPCGARCCCLPTDVDASATFFVDACDCGDTPHPVGTAPHDPAPKLVTTSRAVDLVADDGERVDDAPSAAPIDHVNAPEPPPPRRMA